MKKRDDKNDKPERRVGSGYSGCFLGLFFVVVLFLVGGAALAVPWKATAPKAQTAASHSILATAGVTNSGIDSSIFAEDVPASATPEFLIPVTGADLNEAQALTSPQWMRIGLGVLGLGLIGLGLTLKLKHK